MDAENAAGENLWEPDMSEVPMVWTPPPGWPTPPADWYPPAGWHPSPHWPKEPIGWEFWRPDPELTARARKLWWDRLCATSLALISSVPGVQIRLNETESAVVFVSAGNRRATTPTAEEIRAGSVLPSDDWYRVRCLRTAGSLLTTLGAIRSHLLEVARSAAPADGSAYARLRQERQAASREWFDAVFALVERRADSYGARYGAEAASEFRELLLDQWTGPSDTDPVGDAAWLRAEHLAASFLRGLGFRDAQVTQRGADEGLDVTGTGVVAQVKYLSVNAGRPDLQRLAGASPAAARMVFFSRSGFTAQARQFAETARIALFELELPATVTPHNRTAEELQRAAG